MGCGKCKKRTTDNGKQKPGTVKKSKLTQTEVDEIKKQLKNLGLS